MVLWDPSQFVEIGGGLNGDRHDLAVGCFQKHGSKSRCSGSTSRSLQLLPSGAGGEGGSVGFPELLHGLEPVPVSLHPPAPSWVLLLLGVGFSHSPDPFPVSVPVLVDSLQLYLQTKGDHGSPLWDPYTGKMNDKEFRLPMPSLSQLAPSHDVHGHCP